MYCSFGAVHKRRHQSRGDGGLSKDFVSYEAYIVDGCDDEGGGGCQKSLKIDQVFYERPLLKAIA